MCSGSSKACLRALPDSQHDQVDDLVLAVEHQVVQPQQGRGALVERGARPGRLRPPGPAERLGDVVVASTAACAPSGCPVSGEDTTTDSPLVATSRRVSAAAYSGSKA